MSNPYGILESGRAFGVAQCLFSLLTGRAVHRKFGEYCAARNFHLPVMVQDPETGAERVDAVPGPHEKLELFIPSVIVQSVRSFVGMPRPPSLTRFLVPGRANGKPSQTCF